MTTMEATSPLASESATLDSTSLVDAASSTGEDFLMLDTPTRLDDAQPAANFDTNQSKGRLEPKWHGHFGNYIDNTLLAFQAKKDTHIYIYMYIYVYIYICIYIYVYIYIYNVSNVILCTVYV